MEGALEQYVWMRALGRCEYCRFPSEYRNGEIIAMAGGSPEHSLIIANVIGEVRSHLKGKPCRVYDSNLRIRIDRGGRYSYPDASVTCGDVQYDPADRQQTTALNPRVLIEVLSKSTEVYDRGDKFRRYLELPSVEKYVMISQDEPRGETILRQNDGTWLLTVATNLQAVLCLRSLGIEVPLHEIYSGVAFAPKPLDAQGG